MAFDGNSLPLAQKAEWPCRVFCSTGGAVQIRRTLATPTPWPVDQTT